MMMGTDHFLAGLYCKPKTEPHNSAEPEPKRKMNDV